MSGPAPKRAFSQNFLTSPDICRRIAELATTPPHGSVVEIGPGQGALTAPLLDRAARLVSIERDRDLVPLLAERFSAYSDAGAFHLVEGDALDADWAAMLAELPRPHVVAGNIPYAITGPLIEKATHLADRLDRVVFLVQKEVADRLAAPPDSDAYGALSVFVQAAFAVERPIVVRAGSFFPRPKVDSAVVTLTPHRPRRAEETPAFRELVKRAFAARRKTLRNAWKGALGWSQAELDARAEAARIDLSLRGEVLSVEDFARMAGAPPLSG